ncbi:hypothetical protein Trydic_g20860 [Trypoxylus dichotomus]
MYGTLALLMNGRSKFDPAHKILLYKAILRPMVPKRLCGRPLPRALDVSWCLRNITLHEDDGIEPHMDFIRTIATRLFHKATDYWNPLVPMSQEYDPCSRPLVMDYQDWSS